LPLLLVQAQCLIATSYGWPVQSRALLEEPTVPEDPEGHARIVREGGLPIAAGENLRTVWEFKLYIDCGGVTFPGRSGHGVEFDWRRV